MKKIEVTPERIEQLSQLAVRRLDRVLTGMPEEDAAILAAITFAACTESMKDADADDLLRQVRKSNRNPSRGNPAS